MFLGLPASSLQRSNLRATASHAYQTLARSSRLHRSGLMIVFNRALFLPMPSTCWPPPSFCSMADSSAKHGVLELIIGQGCEREMLSAASAVNPLDLIEICTALAERVINVLLGEPCLRTLRNRNSPRCELSLTTCRCRS